MLRLLPILTIMLSATLLWAAGPHPVSEPAAYIPGTFFESPDTVEEENISHDFVIQNIGTSVLKVHRGRSECGFTVNSIPEPIPPGGEGIVSVLFCTYGAGGKTLEKTVTVTTNDPARARIPLTVKAKIIKPYTLSSKTVKLKGRLGKIISKTLTLSPTRNNPFTIQEITAKRGKNIRFDLEEIKKKNKNKVQYELTVENIAETPGIYYDTLYVETDSKIKPTISITVIGKIEESI